MSWAWVAPALVLLLWHDPATALGYDETGLVGKTRNGCAYEAIYSSIKNTVTKGKTKRETQAAFRRQTWDGECVDGNLHGFGTLHDKASGKNDVDVLTYQGVLFVNGKHLWAPRIYTNLDNFALLKDETLYFATHEYLIGFFDTNYTGFGHFYGTNEDGGIEPAEVYTQRPLHLAPYVYFRQGYTFRGKRADWMHLWARESYCNGLAYCLEVGEEKIQCESDCRAEWDEASASGMAALGGYLDEEMPKLEAIAQTSEVDISGVRAMLAPFVARAETLRVAQAARQRAQADAARKAAMKTATEAGQLMGSPSLDKLLKQALGARP